MTDRWNDAGADHPDRGLIERLRARIDESLRSALGDAREVALVNFHSPASAWPRRIGNPGDMAIWLGALAALRRLDVKIAYQCAWDTLSVSALRRRLPYGPILLTGGGDFGNLYPFGTPETRERLLREFPSTPIIQLPVAVYVREQGNADRLRRLVAEHDNFILMVRDSLSESRARKFFEADTRVVPDLAFSLGALARPTAPEVDVVWHTWLPADTEYVDHGRPPDGLSSRTIEWTRRSGQEPSWRLEHRLYRRLHVWLGRRLGRWPMLRGPLWRPYGATFEPLACASVARAVALEGAGRVLVTNKLHGHVIALLAGIPHVVMDNSFGKVGGVYRTWTESSELAHWVHDGDAARSVVVELLRRPG